MAMSFASALAFADHDVDFLRRAATYEFESERLADGVAVKLGVHVFEARYGMAGERDENVADHYASFVRGTFRLDFENDGGGFFITLEGFAKRVGQAHGLQADAEIALRDVAFFEQGVNDAVNGGRRDGDGAEAFKARRGDADDMASRVYYRAADGGGLQADVKADVGSEGRAGPSTTLGGDETDYAEGGDGTAGASAADNQGEAAGLQLRNITEIGDGGGSFRAFQDRKIGGGIAANKRSGDYALVGQGELDFFIAAQRVFGSDDDARAPDHTARGAAGFGVNSDDVGRGALGGLRQGVGKIDEFG
jgi:hypothetical protein